MHLSTPALHFPKLTASRQSPAQFKIKGLSDSEREAVRNNGTVQLGLHTLSFEGELARWLAPANFFSNEPEARTWIEALMRQTAK